MLKRNNYCLGLAMKELMSTLKLPLLLNLPLIVIRRYHLKDVIIGKIFFLLVRIKLKNMDLEIRRRESTGSGANTHVETETLAKFELMDGVPVRGTLYTVLCNLSIVMICSKAGN